MPPSRRAEGLRSRADDTQDLRCYNPPVIYGVEPPGTWMRRRLSHGTVTRDRRPFILLLTASLIWTVLAVARPVLRAGNGLVGEYFTNAEWNGAPAFSVV